MKKRTIKFILAIATIINILAAILLFVDIQLIQTPETTISIDIIEINSDEMIIQTTMEINNPNGFGLITKNLNVVTTAPNGNEVANVLIEGGAIPANDHKKFTATAVIAFDGQSPELLTTKITGSIGVNIGFIQKTIPLSINIITSVKEVIKELAVPDIDIQIKFGEITQKQINITATIDAYNPNTFDIYIENISIRIETETGKSVGNLYIPSDVIAAKNTTTLNSSGTILLDALNAKELIVNMSGAVGANIAGINKSASLHVKLQIEVPDLSMFLSDAPTDVVIRGDFKASVNGLLDNITLEFYNPNKIELVAKGITVSIYRIDGDEKQLISKGNLGDSIIEAESETFIKGQLIIPYVKLLPPSGGSLLPDWMQVTVRANITIQGLNQSIYIGLSGYQDMHPLR